MSNVLPRFVQRPAVAAWVVAGGLATFAAPPAHAQLFNFLFGDDGLRSSQIERMLEIRGMQPLGPIARNGRVYIADVAVSGGRTQRLVIDAYDGRILEKFKLGPRYYGDLAAPARPASDIGADASERPAASASSSGGWPFVIPFVGESVARGDDSGSPTPLHGDDADAKNKAKAQAKQHKKIDLTQPSSPLTQPSSPPPADAKPATSEASASAPTATDARPAPAPTASAPIVAPTPKAPGGKPAINDVPVSPLD
ncbi:MAG TPA: hypothetical protein VEK35_03325 [Roseiarcus sp.]|nr:hypothetical protein [Roseiarcus sp.]